MPDSEDEYAVMTEVDILVTKIKRAEIHFNTEMDTEIRKSTSFRHAPRGEPSSSPRHHDEGAGPPSTLRGVGSCLKPQEVCEQPDQG